jgi:hypothetical protein
LVCIQREPGSTAANASRSAAHCATASRSIQHAAGHEEAMHHTFVVGERDAVASLD